MTKRNQSGSRKPLSKRLSVRLSCLLAVVVLSGLTGKSYLFSPLPRGAYPVLSTANWEGRGPGDAPPHHWLPNGDLAYLINDAHGMPLVCYQKMDARGPIGAVRHGQELPLGTWGNQFFLSPDEQWVATMQFTPPRHFQTRLISADGKTTLRDGEYFSGWLADSRSYLAISMGQNSATKIFHLDSPRTETIPKVDPVDSPIAVTMLPGSPDFLVGSHFYHSAQKPSTPRNDPLMTLRSFSAAHPGIIQQDMAGRRSQRDDVRKSHCLTGQQVPALDFGETCMDPVVRLAWKRERQLAQGSHV